MICTGLIKRIQIYGYGSLDNKWVVTDPGNYTITLNQATEKLVVKKID